MFHYNQNKYGHVKYGDASLKENGCACCVMASILDVMPQAIANQWRDKYWDDELGTLPEAFDNAADDFGIKCNRIESNFVNFRANDLLVVLRDNGERRTYELYDVGVYPSVNFYSSLLDNVVKCSHEELSCRCEDAEVVWRVNR